MEDTYVHLVGERLILDVLRNREDFKELRLLQERSTPGASQPGESTDGNVAAEGSIEGKLPASAACGAEATPTQAR